MRKHGVFGAMGCWMSVLALAVVMLLADTARAQCERWQAAIPQTAADGAIADAVLFDSDGSGPTPERLLVAGVFQTVGDVFSPRLAYWNGQRFEPWDGPNARNISAPVAMTQREGELYLLSGQTVLRPIDGRWEQFGPRLPRSFWGRSFLRWFQGELYVISSSPTTVLRLRGDSWELGATFPFGGGPINAVLEYQGALFIAGAFANVDGVWVGGIARFDGTQWTNAGAIRRQGAIDTKVTSLMVFRGDLIAVGTLSWQSLNTTRFVNIARWDGSTWSTLVPGTSPSIVAAGSIGSDLFALARVPTGFSVNFRPAVMRLNGQSWQEIADWPRNTSFVSSFFDVPLLPPIEFDGKLVILPTTERSAMTVLNAAGVDERVGIDSGARRSVGWREHLAVLSAESRLYVSPQRGFGAWREIQIRTPGFGGPYQVAQDMCEWDGKLVVCGSSILDNVGDPFCILQYDGIEWQNVGPPNELRGQASQVFIHQGKLHIAGDLYLQGVNSPVYLAEFDGVHWRPAANFAQVGTPGITFGTSFYSNETVSGRTLVWFSSGDRLFLGGALMTVAGEPVRACAVYSGQRWQSLDDGFPMDTYPVSFADVNGVIHAGSQYLVHQLVGAAWQPLSGLQFFSNGLGGVVVGSVNDRLQYGSTPSVFASLARGQTRSFDTVYGVPYRAGRSDYGMAGDLAVLTTEPPSVTFGSYPSLIRRFVGQTMSLSAPLSNELGAVSITVERDGVDLASGQQPSGAVVRANLYAIGVSNLTLAESGEYRIRADRRCGSPVRSSTVRLQVFCLADANRSGVVDAQDIFDYLNAWFAGVWSTDGPVINPPTTGELFRFLAAWFAGC